jgi:hypothetical protein
MPKPTSKNALNAKEAAELIAQLQSRFEKTMARHKGITWAVVERKLSAQPGKIWSLAQMEQTGGEPDVVAYDKRTGVFIFMDCAPESPAGRRSVCYDRTALEARKENKPKGSAVEMAEQMGAELLTEDDYRALQKLGAFDLKTSSWILTPEKIRKLGGALFCDRRYDQVFTYHNSAESYYAARGFRCKLMV